jgi:hypothetical protein
MRVAILSNPTKRHPEPKHKNSACIVHNLGAGKGTAPLLLMGRNDTVNRQTLLKAGFSNCQSLALSGSGAV